MLNILGGAAVFCVVFSFSNYLICRFEKSYEQNAVQFITLFVSMAAAAVWFFSTVNFQLSLTGNVVLISVAALSYAVYSVWWGSIYNRQLSCEHLHLPEVYNGMLRKTFCGGVAKVAEILLQQVCALIVLAGLVSFELALWTVSGLFALVVYIVHLPSVRMFGPVFGRFFLYSSTGLAPVFPIVVYGVPYALGAMVCLHTLIYILWWHYVPHIGYLRKEKPQTL